MMQREMLVVLSIIGCLSPFASSHCQASFPLGGSLRTPTQEVTRGLTLAEAIDIALEQSPLLHAAQHEVTGAQAAVRQAQAGFLPTLDMQETITRSNNPLFVYGAKIGQGVLTQEDFTIERLNKPDTANDFHTTLSVVQPLYDSGKAIFEMRRAKFQRQAQDRHLNRQRQEVIFAVAKAYYAMLLAQKISTCCVRPCKPPRRLCGSLATVSRPVW